MKTLLITAGAVVVTSLASFACTGGPGDISSSSGSTSNGSTSPGSSQSSGSTNGGSGTFSCDTKSKCPNQEALTAEQKEQCQKVFVGECGDEYRAYGNCFIENEQCKDDGTSDTSGTAEGPCKTESDAFSACFLRGLDAGQ